MTTELEPADRAREIIEANRYMTLGTVEPDGRARVSPVYYAPDGHSVLYWISSPAAQHSRNVAERPDVSIVVFDSQAPIGQAQAVYMTGHAALVPESDLDDCAEVACRARFPEQQPFPLDELRGPAPFRLYRADVTEHEIHVRGSDPVHGTGIDRRMGVTLS